MVLMVVRVQQRVNRVREVGAREITDGDGARKQSVEGEKEAQASRNLCETNCARVLFHLVSE